MVMSTQGVCGGKMTLELVLVLVYITATHPLPSYWIAYARILGTYARILGTYARILGTCFRRVSMPQARPALLKDFICVLYGYKLVGELWWELDKPVHLSHYESSLFFYLVHLEGKLSWLFRNFS
jgi:hypothetical protein